MNILPRVAQHLRDVSYGNNWTEVNIKNTLQGIDHKKATTQSSFSENTIAALIHHLAYWNRVMIQRIKGVKPVIPPSNGFDVPVIGNEDEWKNLVAAYMLSADELDEAICAMDEEKLEEPILAGYPSRYKSIQGAVEHIHYHLGQIVMIKKALGND